jgi:hypothetical protein
MREVLIADEVVEKISKLRVYLIDQLKLSRYAAHRRTDRIDKFLLALGKPGDYAPCRNRVWRAMGYRCVAFEGWVFAYESFPDGVIVRDMAHGKLLVDKAD